MFFPEVPSLDFASAPAGHVANGQPPIEVAQNAATSPLLSFPAVPNIPLPVGVPPPSSLQGTPQALGVPLPPSLVPLAAPAHAAVQNLGVPASPFIGQPLSFAAPSPPASGGGVHAPVVNIPQTSPLGSGVVGVPQQDGGIGQQLRPSAGVPSDVPSAVTEPRPTPSVQGALGNQRVAPGATSGRQACAIIAFNFGGHMFRAQANGSAQEDDLHELLKPCMPKWYVELDSFPGPLGRVEPRTTEALGQHLQSLAARLAAGDTAGTTLESAVTYPRSVAVTCDFLRCMMTAGGKLQSPEFWQRFSTCLADRAAASMPSQAEASPLQVFCTRLAQGEVVSALESVHETSLWAHALVIAQLVSPEAYDRLLVHISSSLRKPGVVSNFPSGLADQESADPMVQALLLLYDVLGRGSIPEFSDLALSHWTSYLAVFSVILRPNSQHRLLGRQFLESLASGLANKGDIFGAHVCYLLTGERKLDSVDAPASLVCLIGVEHRSPQNFTSLLDPLALQLSEVFEYAIRCGDPDALCPTIQPFKLAHTLLLFDVGLVDKARKYMTLLQAFVKAVPQNRLSDAFRSSMRELNDLLNPSLALGSAEAPRVGKSIKDLFRGFAETTGFAVKPTPPPALAGDDDDDDARPAFTSQFDGGFPGMHRPPATPMLVTTSAAAVTTPGTHPAAPAQPRDLQQPMVNQQLQHMQNTNFGSMPNASVAASQFPPSSGMPNQACSSVGNVSAYVPISSNVGAGGESTEAVAQQQPPEPMQDALQHDPLLNAGKAVWSGVRGLFSAVKGSDASKASAQQNTDSQANAFYYDSVAKKWRERGAESEPDASQFDPMTGKKLGVVADLPPPPMGVPPPMDGPPPMGGPPPMNGPPPMGAPPPMTGPPPMGGPPPVGGLPPSSGSRGPPLPHVAASSPFGGPPQMAGAAPGRAGGGVAAGAGRGSLYVNPMSGVPYAAPSAATPPQRAMPVNTGMALASPFSAAGMHG
mmetsp:Transcript_142998/g.456929  ORF Transcript_142998/g.456929 Transcript_142998/m.456929 type:complete len:983 (+) Transcript_142998:26-2974(+)